MSQGAPPCWIFAVTKICLRGIVSKNTAVGASWFEARNIVASKASKVLAPIYPPSTPHLPPLYADYVGKIAGCASILVVPISHSLVWVIGILWCWFCTQGSHADLCRFLDWTWGSSSTWGSPKPSVSISWFFGGHQFRETPKWLGFLCCEELAHLDLVECFSIWKPCDVSGAHYWKVPKSFLSPPLSEYVFPWFPFLSIFYFWDHTRSIFSKVCEILWWHENMGGCAWMPLG